jgi:phosphoribosylanthranilate isomerase
MIVQIYEIQTPHEAEKCLELGVDHLGSVLLSKEEWRLPVLEEVMRLSSGAGAKSSLIPLFDDHDTLYRALDYYRPGYVHFCESLTDREGREIELDRFIGLQTEVKERFPAIGIMRSIPIPRCGLSGNFPTLKIARSLEPVSDLFLTDTWLEKEPVEGFIGITGKTVDWETARELVHQSSIPVILAGGLSPENVFQAIMKVLPAGADSCTLTNRVDEAGRTARFEKDLKKVGAFVEEVRRAEKEIRRERMDLEEKLEQLKEDLRDRERALPAHSVRPHQLMAVEALEEEVAQIERELHRLKEIV